MNKSAKILIIPEQLELGMEEEQNSGTLEATTEPIVVDAGRVFVNTGQNFPVQKNAAAKVIGILVIVYYCLGIVLGILSIIGLPLLNDFVATQDPSFDPIPMSLVVLGFFISLIPQIIGCIGGWKMYNYEKIGIWIVFGSLIIGWVLTIFYGVLTTDYGGSGDAGFDAAFNGICGIFDMAICGVIVAIPLMLNDGGME